MFELERIMYTITRSPGEFDNLIPSFINNIRREGNMRYLRTFVTSIIDWVCLLLVRQTQLFTLYSYVIQLHFMKIYL